MWASLHKMECIWGYPDAIQCVFSLHQKHIDSRLYGFQWPSSHQYGQFQCITAQEKKVEHGRAFSAQNCTGIWQNTSKTHQNTSNCTKNASNFTQTTQEILGKKSYKNAEMHLKHIRTAFLWCEPALKVLSLVFIFSRKCCWFSMVVKCILKSLFPGQS